MFNSSIRSVLATVLGLASASFLSSAPALAQSARAVQAAGISPVKAEARQQTIVDIAASAGSFNTLTAALKAADLVEVLAGKGPFTRISHKKCERQLWKPYLIWV